MGISASPRPSRTDGRAHDDSIVEKIADHPVTEQVKDTARDASPWIEKLGRFGYATKGVVYIIIGVLSAMAAFGAGGGTTDQRAVFSWLYGQPFGRPLLGVLIVGLIGYVVWRLVQAIVDTENKGTDAKGIQGRGAYVVSAFAYSTLAVSAFALLMSGSGSDGDASTRDSTAMVMALPFGRWIIGAIGAALFATGLAQFYVAYKATFDDKQRNDEMTPDQKAWLVRLGRLGFSARGVSFCIIGGFLMVAALRANAEEAVGLGGALTTIASQPYGQWLLGIVAIGLACYGVFMLAEARYRRMEIR